MGAMGGVGKIPFTAIAEYADRFYDGDLEFLSELMEIIPQMDQVLLDYISEQMEEDQKQRELKAKESAPHK